ncbi:DNA methyltransferase [Microbispora sp. ATCC PTA-5024]|uniref:DNA methyltransferase n=1 Tax=Microbispora sp. ATCC PTA-5024 TaxID=316330 RepID=UPI001E42BBCF|nr:DNA methyltransferase [Microbispora sp. ATCC PTA-5024]
MDEGSVDCIVTSPPYWGLRNYCEGQYGQEATPEAYVENLRVTFAEARRVLADDGTCWLNLGVRHEAPWNRAEVKGLRRCLVAAGQRVAGGSLIRETPGRVGAAPTTTGRVGTAGGPGSGKRGRKVYVRNQRYKAPQVKPPAQTLRIWAGLRRPLAESDAAAARGPVIQGGFMGSWGRSAAYPWQAAGAQLGIDPADRFVVNVGTRVVLPVCPVFQAGSGKARRPLMTLRGGGAAVVVRGRESRSHGEGRQGVSDERTGMPGGRR